MLTWDLASLATKVIGLAGIAGVVGGTFSLYLASLLSPSVSQPVSRYLMLCASIGFFSTAIFFLVQVGAINQSGFAGIWDWLMFRILADSSLGYSTGLKLVAFALAAGCGFILVCYGNDSSKKLLKKGAYGLLIVAVIALDISFLLTGHVSNLGLLAHAILALHILAVFLWTGSLWPLHSFCQESDRDPLVLGMVMTRFGQIAIGIVAVLIASGLGILYLLLESWSEIFTTAYGRGILFKLLLVIGLLGLAAINKLRLVPNLAGTNGVSLLARSIKLEIVLAMFILIITSYVTLIIGLE